MSPETDPVHVIRFPFSPIRGRPEQGRGVDLRRILWEPSADTEQGAMSERKEVVDDGIPSRSSLPQMVGAAQIQQGVKGGLRIVSKGSQHIDYRLTRHLHRGRNRIRQDV